MENTESNQKSQSTPNEYRVGQRRLVMAVSGPKAVAELQAAFSSWKVHRSIGPEPISQMLRPAYQPDDAHCPSAGGPAGADGRNPSADECESRDPFSAITSERWHPLPGAPRRNRGKCSSKEGHVNSLRGSGLSSRALFAALLA